jgi:hypothetical protein
LTPVCASKKPKSSLPIKNEFFEDIKKSLSKKITGQNSPAGCDQCGSTWVAKKTFILIGANFGSCSASEMALAELSNRMWGDCLVSESLR